MDFETKLCGPAGTHTTASHLGTHEPCIFEETCIELQAMKKLHEHVLDSPELLPDMCYPGVKEWRIGPIVIRQHHLPGRC